MTTAENKALLQNIFAELAKGNARPFVDGMADDFAWTITGMTAWSKTYRGKKVVVEELLGALRERLEPPIVTIAQRFIADGDFVAVEACGKKSHQGRSAVRKQVLFRLPRGGWQAARADGVFGHGTRDARVRRAGGSSVPVRYNRGERKNGF